MKKLLMVLMLGLFAFASQGAPPDFYPDVGYVQPIDNIAEIEINATFDVTTENTIQTAVSPDSDIGKTLSTYEEVVFEPTFYWCDCPKEDAYNVRFTDKHLNRVIRPPNS